jgi:hypothetical protein
MEVIRAGSLAQFIADIPIFDRDLMPNLQLTPIFFSQKTANTNHSHPTGVLAKAQKKVVGMAL